MKATDIVDNLVDRLIDAERRHTEERAEVAKAREAQASAQRDAQNAYLEGVEKGKLEEAARNERVRELVHGVLTDARGLLGGSVLPEGFSERLNRAIGETDDIPF